jgi:hypothetical protein
MNVINAARSHHFYNTGRFLKDQDGACMNVAVTVTALVLAFTTATGRQLPALAKTDDFQSTTS